MKANDLMIGDWVRMKENHDVAFQMEDVSGSDMFKRWTSDGEYMIPYSYSEIEPIPITPEILEKNFGEARNGGYFEGDEFYELFIIEVNDGTWIIKHDDIEFPSIPRQQVMVGYVHEFQRALRCFGLFNLANNFKI